MPAKLIIRRKGEWFNRRKPFRIFINGNDYGLLSNDQTVEYDLEPGVYQIQIKYNWMSSPEYTVHLQDDINHYLSVSNGMKYIVPLYIAMLAGLFLPFFLKIARLQAPDAINLIKIVLIVPALVYILAYISVLRKRYININEDKSHPFRT